jgi:uncharacterized damage-inducible protein DinB
MLKAHFVEQADYQRWANNELFKSLDTLNDHQRRDDMGLFFKDIHKTVDHILVVTRNWKFRLMGEGEKATPYSELLHEDWNALKAALDDEFRSLGEWLFAQHGDWFSSTVTYTSGGKQGKAVVSNGLTHIMTHAVHHRGQVTAIITQLNAPSPKMDFVFYRRRK